MLSAMIGEGMDIAPGKLVRTAGNAPQAAESREFDDLYVRHFSFVWRNLRRLGVPEALVEDAAQDTFVVVHRRLSDLRPDASPKAWLFGIALRVAHDYRRTRQRKPALSLDAETQASPDRGPFEKTARAQAGRVLHRFLETLDPDKRAVFMLAEMEEMSAPEMS
jgi:RNA polymerase sigma-70 factor (ECF subfamily)